MMESAWILGIGATTLIAIITQSGLLWYKLGKLENSVKKACPFGQCPIFKRATNEAAPQRTEPAS